MMILSLVAMTELEKCYMTSAHLQKLFHSGERTVVRGLVLFIVQIFWAILDVHQADS